MSTTNDLTQPNAIRSWTDDPLAVPVTARQLAEYAGLMTGDEPANSPVPQKELLELLLEAATNAVISYTGSELKKRDWHYQADRYPARRQGYGGLGPLAELPAWWVDLPMHPVIKVDAVQYKGVDADEWKADGGRVFVSPQAGVLRIDYQAGYDTVPPWARLAILAIANYLFDNRGCTIKSAVTESGAGAILQPHRRIFGL